MIDFPTSAGESDSKRWILGGITEYPDDRYAVLVSWVEVVENSSGDEVGINHLYLATIPNSGGTPTIQCELEISDFFYFSAGEMVYLPTDGVEPACIVIANSNHDGVRGAFMVFNLDGSLRREIFATDLYLADQIGQCSYNSSLEALPNGDLLALASDYEISDCPDWPYCMAVTFNRYGDYKGAWSFGGSLLADPWYPNGFNAMAVLPSGHLYVSSFFAEYFWEPLRLDARYGDREYHTYRHFLVEPPYALGSPLLETSLDEIDLGRGNLGKRETRDLTLSNLGSAELVISEIAIDDGKGEIVWTGPESLNLASSFGLPSVEGSSVTHSVELSSLILGRKSATLRIESNDPTESIKRILVEGYGVPVTYGFEAIFDLDSTVTAPYAGGFCQISSDGLSALISIYVNDADPRYTRLVRVPIIRGGNRIVGLDTSGMEVVYEFDGIAGYDLVEGPGGTLWMGAGNGTTGAFNQILPDGTLLETPLPIAGSLAPRAFCFAPDGQHMLVVRNTESQVHLLSLNPRSGGGYDLSYVSPVGPPVPRAITQMLQWVEDTMAYTLVEFGDTVRVETTTDAGSTSWVLFDEVILDESATALMDLDPGESPSRWYRVSTVSSTE